MLQNDKQVDYRHNGGANVAYVDGHAKWKKFGSSADSEWDVRCFYGQICNAARMGSSIYPAPDRTCGNMSPVNCQ
jgi:prepilin-type processing-associated H-X9-DG protein